MKNIYVMCGIPGSGKSSWVAKQIKDVGYIGCRSFNADNIRAEINGDPTSQEQPRLVFDILNRRFLESLLDVTVNNIFIDNTSILREYRKRYVDLVEKVCLESDISYSINIVYMNISLKTCLTRNANRERKVPNRVIERMYRQFEFFSEEERAQCKIVEIKEINNELVEI